MVLKIHESLIGDFEAFFKGRAETVFREIPPCVSADPRGERGRPPEWEVDIGELQTYGERMS